MLLAWPSQAQTLVELPAGAEPQTWYFNGTAIDGVFGGNYERTNDEVEVAFVGNEVYLRDIFSYLPDSWIKGTINGTSVTFQCPQYLGSYQEAPCYAYGFDGFANLQDFQMTYDEAAQTLTSVNMLLENFGDEELSLLDAYENFTISKEKPFVEEPTAATGPNVSTLPYSNVLATANDFAVFGVLDTNADEVTWTYTNNSDSGSGVCYGYSRFNTGDDWLVSPAIKLEAGKNYHFAIDARGLYTAGGRFEVKAATGEAKASVLAAGTEIISSTDATANFLTYENQSFTVSETGYYHFGVHAISDEGYGYLFVANFLVEEGPDASAPAAVGNLVVTPLTDKLGATLTFTAPTKTLGGATLSAGGITRIEILRDGAVVHTIATPNPGASLAYTDEAVNLTIGNHKYQVVCYGASGIGGKSDVVEVFLSGILSVPTSFDLTKQDVFGTFLTIDANDDGFGVWEWDPATGTRYYGSESAADDYLVSTGIQLEAGVSYRVTVSARCHIQGVAERFEVKLGKEATVDGLSQTVINATTVTNDSFENYEGDFTVSESGVYYVAIHAISAADRWRLYVSSLAVGYGAEGTSPAAPTLVAEAGAQGALNATITVTAPATTVDGDPLTANLTKLELLRDGAILNTFTNVKPGAVVTFADEHVTTGSHAYQAIPYDANGAGQKSAKVTVYVGEDPEPANVSNVQVTANAATLAFAWDKAEGKNGGYVNADQVQYSVVALVVGEDVDGDIYMYESETLATVTGTTAATINYPVDEGEQGYNYFGVKATIGDNESDPRANNVRVLVGAPYELPIEETFAGYYAWFGNDNASIAIADEGNGDNTALALAARDQAGVVALETGKLNAQSADKATLVFDAKKGTSAVQQLTVYGITPDGAATDIETITLTDAYHRHQVKIPASIKNNRWSRLGFKVDIEEAEKYVLLDNIKILDLLDHDLSVAIAAPSYVQTGSKATVKATVKNEGANPANGYTIVIKAGDQELLNTAVNDILPSFTTSVFTVDIETSAFDKPANIAITATVVYDGDQKSANNTATATLSVITSNAPGATSVAAEDTADGLVVTWKAPDTEVEQAAKTTEDFEAGEAGWTFIDADADGFNWGYISDKSLEGTLAHSGKGIVYSESYGYVSETLYFPLTPDNWLVSPQAVLGGTFKFWAVGQDPDDCAEHFQVFVSTASATDVSTFEPVGEEFIATNEYKEYAVDLSAYAGKAGWVAIRHFNVTDMFRLLVDDITYHIGIEKYNVYVDGKLATTVAANQSTATLKGVSLEGHTVTVSVVYVNGRESNPIEANLPSGINKAVIVAKPVDVYSLDGRIIRRQATTLDGLKGIYIVGGKQVILK